MAVRTGYHFWIVKKVFSTSAWNSILCPFYSVSISLLWRMERSSSSDSFSLFDCYESSRHSVHFIAKSYRLRGVVLGESRNWDIFSQNSAFGSFRSFPSNIFVCYFKMNLIMVVLYLFFLSMGNGKNLNENGRLSYSFNIHSDHISLPSLALITIILSIIVTLIVFCIRWCIHRTRGSHDNK